MLSPSPGIERAGSSVNSAWPQDPAVLMTALSGLVASQGLPELAGAAARLLEKLFSAEQAIALFQAGEGIAMGAQPKPGSPLESWAQGLLRDEALPAPIRTAHMLAVGVEAREAGVRGVLAVSLPSIGGGDVADRLVELGHLVSTCIDQVVSRARTAQALKDAQATLAKGLHDLRTPLNSLRLGMHLLEPGLAGQDPAIVQRTHRAVDRMAALVTEMFDALHKN